MRSISALRLFPVGLLLVASAGMLDAQAPRGQVNGSALLAQPTGCLYVGLRLTFGAYAGADPDHLVLFSDGSVLWRLPDEGLDGFDAAQSRREMPDFWGTYQVAGGRARIRWLNGSEDLAQLEHDGRLVFRGSTYWPRGSCDDLRLEGNYARSDLGPDTPEISFHSDGSFEDRGILPVLGIVDELTGRFRVSPEPGSGTYRCSSNTLALDYTDGRAVRFSFYLAREDEHRPTVIVVHTYGLQRRP